MKTFNINGQIVKLVWSVEVDAPTPYLASTTVKDKMLVAFGQTESDCLEKMKEKIEKSS